MSIKKRVISMCMAAATVASMVSAGAVTASADTLLPKKQPGDFYNGRKIDYIDFRVDGPESYHYGKTAGKQSFSTNFDGATYTIQTIYWVNDSHGSSYPIGASNLYTHTTAPKLIDLKVDTAKTNRVEFKSGNRVTNTETRHTFKVHWGRRSYKGFNSGGSKYKITVIPMNKNKTAIGTGVSRTFSGYQGQAEVVATGVGNSEGFMATVTAMTSDGKSDSHTMYFDKNGNEIF